MKQSRNILSRAGGLHRFTYRSYRYAYRTVSYKYTRLFPESISESAEVSKRERISYQRGGYTWNRVRPYHRYQRKSDLWKQFDLRKRKTDGRTDGDVAVCKVPLSNLREASQTCQRVGSGMVSDVFVCLFVCLFCFVLFCLFPRFLTDLTARHLEVGSTGRFYWLSLSTLVDKPTFFLPVWT